MASARLTAGRRRQNYPKLLILGSLIAIVLVIGLLLTLGSEERGVAFPMLVAICTTIVLFAALWQRDGIAPSIDLGFICVAVTSVYVAYPLMALLASGLSWSDLSDNRLRQFQATPALFAKVGWWGALYLVCVAGTYLAVRKRPTVTFDIPLHEPSRVGSGAIVAAFILIWIFTQLVQILFNVDLNPGYGPDVQVFRNLPLWLEQILGKLVGIGIVLQVALILLLVNRREVIWRWVLWLWAACLVVTLLTVFGSRSSLVFFALMWLLAHQRLRRPLGPVAFGALALGLVAAILLYGFARDIGEMGEGDFSAGNEFQSLYVTAYHILFLRDSGGIGDVPWQLYFADFLRPIPQQLLPFEKMDQGEWYLDLLGARGRGVGFMFGVISEAAIGLGLFEIAVRGMIVGALLAAIHNWYARNATRFWPTVFYVWLCVWSYYTYRASTFYLLGHVLTMFLPAYLLIRAFESRATPAPRTARQGAAPR